MLWCQVVGVIFDCYQCSGNCPLMISSNLSSVFHKQILVQLLANSCHISRDGKYRNFYRNFLKTSTFYIYIYIYISSICTTDFKELWINMGSTEMQREIWDRPWKLSGRGCSRFFFHIGHYLVEFLLLTGTFLTLDIMGHFHIYVKPNFNFLTWLVSEKDISS